MLLTNKEKEMIVIALNMRRNYIETGDVVMSAAQSKKMGKLDTNALSVAQMQLIIDTENLIKRLYNS